MKKIFLILFIFIFSFSFLNAKTYEGEIKEIYSNQIILTKEGFLNSVFNFIGFINQEIVPINENTKYYLKENNKEIYFKDLKIGLNVLLENKEHQAQETNNIYKAKTETNPNHQSLSLFDFFNSKIQNFSVQKEQTPSPTVKQNNQEINCSNEKNFICGVDGKTYFNECYAKEAKIQVDCVGECPCKKTYSFNFLNIFNTTTKPSNTSNKIVYKSLDDFYAQYNQEKNKKTNSFVKNNQLLKLKEIKEQEKKIEALVYPNKAIPNETIAFSINPDFLLNKIYFPLHEKEIDPKYSSLDDFETGLMFTISLKDAETNEIVATIQNKNRDYIRWLQSRNDHLGFTFRIVYDESQKGYTIDSPHKTEHNKNTEIVAPIEGLGWKSNMETLLKQDNFVVTNKKTIELNKKYVFEVQKDYYYYETLSDYINQKVTKTIIKETNCPKFIVQTDWKSDENVAYMYTIDNIPLQELVNWPKGIRNKMEELCDGNGVSKEIQDSRLALINSTDKYNLLLPNTEKETSDFKTILHYPGNKKIPFTWLGNENNHYRITQNLSKDCVGELKTKNNFSKKIINTCEPNFCYLDIATHTIKCDMLALNKLCNNDVTSVYDYYKVNEEKTLCWNRDTTDLCNGVTDPTQRQLLNCLDEPKETCESKQDSEKENVWSTRYKYMSTSYSDNIHRKISSSSRYITTYQDIFNRKDRPDENFCFNGRIISNYLEDPNPCDSIKYYLNDKLTSGSSIFTNEYKFTDLIGRIIEMDQKDKTGILCIEFGPDRFLDY